jgi:hypothetical protein
MYDLLTDQLLAIAATKRPGLPADLLAERRPFPEPRSSTPEAASATAADQLLLSASAPPPPAPLPLEPNQPVATRFQVSEVLRRLRGNRRKAPMLPDRVSPEPPEDHPVGHLIDRWL